MNVSYHDLLLFWLRLDDKFTAVSVTVFILHEFVAKQRNFETVAGRGAGRGGGARTWREFPLHSLNSDSGAAGLPTEGIFYLISFC